MHALQYQFFLSAQEIDEDAPESWKQMHYYSTSAEDAYETFDQQTRQDVEKWRELRATRIQRRVQDELQAELETQPSLLRESSPFLRVKVHSLQPKENRVESGYLTIWNPSEEQKAAIREGNTLQFFDLAVRESCFDGRLQLSGHKRTVIEKYDRDTFQISKTIGYKDRHFLTMLEVHKLSHSYSKQNLTDLQIDFDTIALSFHQIESSRTNQENVFYLTDETCLVLRVHYNALSSSSKMFLGGCCTAIGLRDLRLRAFDKHQQCAVAHFGDLSSVATSNPRIDTLNSWASESSASELTLMRSFDLRHCEQLGGKKVGFGYIMGMKLEEGSHKYLIQVDCCGYCCQEWPISSNVLQEMIATTYEHTGVLLTPRKDSKVGEPYYLGLGLRATGILWKFELCPSIAIAHEPTQYVVSRATKADRSSLCRDYLALHDMG